MTPLPYVIGTDIVCLTRDTWKGADRVIRLAYRILHPSEIEGLRHRRKHVYDALNTAGLVCATSKPNKKAEGGDDHKVQGAGVGKLCQFVASRFAAKEAAKKAWGAELIGFKDVRLEYDTSKTRLQRTATPAVKIICQPSEFVGLKEKESLQQEGALSISHDGDYVVATVIAEPMKPELLDAFLNLRRKGDHLV